ncbi:MAG: cobalamin biosynthesis protein CbiD [Firmicutes bacterium]|nr:cobalamin biosynthesis protein CbiD [Bacillota bacterium]
MSLEHYIRKGTKTLRYGYTTGTCAALAAAGALRILLTGQPPEEVSLMTKKGIPVELPLEEWGLDEDSAWAGVPKDAGDDSDVTDGMLICARVRKREAPEGASPVLIDGGKGVGRVTRPGLDQPVGEAAINSGPREMITEEILRVCRELGYEGGVQVEVFVPEGEEAARKTFNANLGIEGGISILGTTGIVEPMSEQALLETIELEMKQDGLAADSLILTPGNYGSHFISEEGLDRMTDEKGVPVPVLKYSNFLGETLDMLPSCGIRNVLLVGHAGKLVKAAGGIMNTHSRWADCRAEILCAHTAVCGGSRELCRQIMDGATTDACFDLLDEAGLLEQVMDSVIGAVQRQLDHRTEEGIRIGVILFSNVRGSLGMSEEAGKILALWNREQ